MITQSQVCETRIARRTFFTGSFLCCARVLSVAASTVADKAKWLTQLGAVTT